MWELYQRAFLRQRRQWHPTPVLLPGKSHGWRSLEGCSPWGRSGSDTTEQLHFHFSLSCIGEGNGNPLQYSCLENPRDGGAWQAAVYGVTQSRTRLKRLSSSSSLFQKEKIRSGILKEFIYMFLLFAEKFQVPSPIHMSKSQSACEVTCAASNLGISLQNPPCSPLTSQLALEESLFFLAWLQSTVEYESNLALYMGCWFSNLQKSITK